MNLEMIRHNFFHNKQGKLVIGQFPNPPIILWAICKILAVVNFAGYASSFAQLSTLFLFTWAYLELTQGVNYFRRLLGTLVTVFILINL